MITKAELEQLEQAPHAYAPLEQELIHTIKKFEAALRFYADERNYACVDHGDFHLDSTPIYALDEKGEKARAVLAEFEGEGK